VTLHGIADPARVAERTPTFSVTVGGRTPREVAETLARDGIHVWDGDFYAYALMRALGLADGGGAVRAGLLHYTTDEEVDRLLDGLAALPVRRHKIV
jgi:selenocysteine lyase/cysteine desulfurase